MSKGRLKTLNDEALKKEHEKYANLFKAGLIVFAIISLTVIGYIGYMDGQGKETGVTEIWGTLLLLSFTGIFPAYLRLSNIKKEIASRTNNNQS